MEGHLRIAQSIQKFGKDLNRGLAGRCQEKTENAV